MLRFLFTCLIVIAILIGLHSCASQGIPTGGPKDIAPPQVLGIVPKDQSVDYRGRVVVITFDEWISEDNIRQNLQITPSTDNEFEHEIKKNVLFLTFKKDFQPNTTYTFNFGESIVDITEKNKALNLTFAFSTGNELDTLTLSGKVVDYLKGTAIKGATVGIFRTSDTLDIDKSKPYYFAKTDSLGNYFIKNIKKGNYRSYALFEPKPDMKYNNADDMIAFRIDSLILNSPTKNFNFGVVRYDTRKMQVKNIKNNRQLVDIKLSKIPLSYRVEFEDKTNDTLIFHSRVDEYITFYHKNKTESDTIRAKLMLEDSTYVKYDTLIKFKFVKSDKQRKNVFVHKVTPTNSEVIEANKTIPLRIEFTKPLLTFSTDSIYFKKDKDTVKYFLKDFNLDETRTVFSKDLTLKFDEKVSITFAKNSFISIENDTLPEFKVDYPLAKVENFGTIGGFVVGRGENYIIQIIDELKKIEKQQIGGKTFRFDFVKPGKKLIRVVIDENNNGKWDAGSFKDKTLPEKIVFYKDEIVLKANWELLEFGIDVDSDK